MRKKCHIKMAKLFPLDLNQRTDYIKGWNALPYTIACAQLGYNLGVMGRIVEGKNLFERGYESELEMVSNLSTKMSYCSWQSLFILLIGDDHFEAKDRIDKLLELADRSDSPFMILVFSVAKANVMLALGDIEAALSSSQKALKAIEGKSIRTGHVANLYYDLVLAELRSGKQESAKHHYEEGKPLLEMAPHWWGPRFDFLQGLLIMAEASPDYIQAKKCFHKSIEGDKEVGAIVPAAQTRFYLAQMLANKGEVENSREMFKELSGQFQDWNMPVWQQKCKHNLGSPSS